MFPNIERYVCPQCSLYLFAHQSLFRSYLLALVILRTSTECTFIANTYTHCRFIIIIILSTFTVLRNNSMGEIIAVQCIHTWNTRVIKLRVFLLCVLKSPFCCHTCGKLFRLLPLRMCACEYICCIFGLWLLFHLHMGCVCVCVRLLIFIL